MNIYTKNDEESKINKKVNKVKKNEKKMVRRKRSILKLSLKREIRLYQVVIVKEVIVWMTMRDCKWKVRSIEKERNRSKGLKL